METNGAARTWDRMMRFLANYHSWIVVNGEQNLPKTGGVMFAATHSLASYELFIVAHATKALLGRQTYIVGDNLMFRIPGMGNALREIGFISASRDELVERLRGGDMVGIAPGGMKEALRGTSERYSFDWSKRMGFASVALRAGVPVLPSVCPLADHIFTVYGNPFSDLVYRKLKIPLPIFRGRGITPIPRPVKLVSLVGKPIYPDVEPDRVTDKDVQRFHTRIVAEVSALMSEARRMGEHPDSSDIRSYS